MAIRLWELDSSLLTHVDARGPMPYDYVVETPADLQLHVQSQHITRLLLEGLSQPWLPYLHLFPLNTS